MKVMGTTAAGFLLLLSIVEVYFCLEVELQQVGLRE